MNPSPSDTFRRCASSSSSEESEESSEEEDKRDTHTRLGGGDTCGDAIDADGRRDGRGGDAINKLKRVPGGTNVGRERNY